MNHDHDLDKQLDRLAPKLRDTGISPERDLWPDIDQAISRVNGVRPVHGRRLTGWRIVALAASVLLLVGVGLVQQSGVPGKSSMPQATRDENVGPLAGAELTVSEDGPGSMQQVDQALADLRRALAADPNNSSLSRLVMMIHKSRGNLTRNTAMRLAAPGG